MIVHDLTWFLNEAYIYGLKKTWAEVRLMMRNQLPTPSNEKNCRKFDYPLWRRPKKFLKIFF